MADPFFDTNVILYLFSSDGAKAASVEDIVAGGGCISVQVLNEFATVARRKLAMQWREIRDISAHLRALCRVVPLTVETHDEGVRLAEAMKIGVYDAMIVASALLARCDVLYTEDLQHGRTVERRLAIRNPFR